MAAVVYSKIHKISSLHGRLTPIVSAGYVQSRHESDVAAFRGQFTNLAAHRRGTGGRSSFSGVVATVLGATGFMGRYIVNRLGKTGCQVIVPYRGDPYHVKELRLMGDLGQILFLPFHLEDEQSLRKVMKYSNVVINLIGRDWETKNCSFADVNYKGAARIAKIAKEVGVERLIHFSHINAMPNPPHFYGKGSEYLRTKYQGEVAVRNAFPDATIMKPADIFGEEDRFIRYYASFWRRFFGFVPLYKNGTATIKMPVLCSDVATGVHNVIYDKDALGRSYECVGPSAYYLCDLIDYFYRCMRWEYDIFPFLRVPVTPAFRLGQWVLSLAPNKPLGGLDVMEREFVSDMIRGLYTLDDLGVKLTRLEDRAPYQLKPFRAHNYYEETVGEFPSPVPPPTLARLNVA